NTTWYTVDGGINNYTFTENGTINQVAWSALTDGVVIIKFYVNNTLGNIYFKQVNVTKNSSAPIIDIVSPVANEIFGINPPSYIVEITDPNLDTMWYSIYNGTYQSLNITFTGNGTINPTEWGALSNGSYTLRFYANNSLGNVNFEEVNIIKDIYAIFINIVNPTENEVFGVNAPSFIVEITSAFLNMTWYTLDGAPKKYIFAVNGTINQTAWMTLPEGIVSISFYANNSLGEIINKQVNVIKDTSVPNINIINPLENEIFGVNPPNFTVEIIDPNLDTMWYSIYNFTHQSLNITFTGNGTIDPTEWGALLSGDYTIRFYANDTIGNINFEEINITKDIYAIFIDIINPIENDVFGADAPSFIIEITGAFLDMTWYTVDGGLNNYTFSINETINEAAWDALSDGVVTIRFYANNSLGDINFEQVNVIKDTSAPTINIVSPTENEIFGVDAPSFIIEITGAFLNMTWYTVDGGLNNYTFSINETINEAAWDALSDGIVTIRFYANNSLRVINFEQVNVIKDTSAPTINIVSPTENEVFGVDAPNFSVVITDTNLDTMWYTINNSDTKYLFSQDGVINQTEWDAQTDGDIILNFYANDTLGNLANEYIIISKSTPSRAGPDIIPIIILVSVIVGIAVVGGVLGFLIKTGKISLEKLSKRKPSTEKTKPEKPQKEKVKKEKTKKEKKPKEKVKKEKTKKEKTPTEENKEN
ncbi:hypothetical protein LCGC14_1847540, partial [marine sediment metagenome]